MRVDNFVDAVVVVVLGLIVLNVVVLERTTADVLGLRFHCHLQRGDTDCSRPIGSYW